MKSDLLHLDIHQSSRTPTLALVLLVSTLLLLGCGRRAATPPAAPAPTVTPTVAIATATATPSTAAPDTGAPDTGAPDTGAPDTGASAAAADVVPNTLQTVVPADFRPVVDEARGYALALPSGWTEFDLRGEQFGNLAQRVGLGEVVTPLTDFLATSAGQGVGVVAATDLSGAIFGGVPTILNASVIDTRASDPSLVLALINRWLGENQQLLAGVTIEELAETTVNGLPAIRMVATVDLSSVGINRALYVESVGLIANEKLYLLTLATEAGGRQEKAAEFSQIIGTFGPQ